MKAKISAAFFVALFILTTQLSLRAQSPDCYSIQCPSKVFAPCEGVYGSHAWFSVTVSNLCANSPNATVTYSSPPGSVFPPGTNIVCATIQIPGLPSRQCCFPVIVDNCCPTNCIDFICPSNIVTACQPAGATPGAFVSLPKPIVTNYCGDHVLPANLQVRCTPPQPTAGATTFFPPGTNTVVCCLTDGQGFTECCCFQVIVTDCPPATSQCKPQIICPTDVQVQCEGPNGGIAVFSFPKIIDPCGLVVGTNITHVSGSLFPNGKTTVASCIAWRDPATGSFMYECCCFDVVVRCCPPTNCVSRLECPTNVVIDCPPASGVVLQYTVTGGNTCEPTTVVCNPPSGSVIYGPTNVCCKLVSSSGISLADCCFNVLVIDTIPPVIHCPTNIVVLTPNCGPIDVSYPLPDATDNCQLDYIRCTPPPGSLFPPGVTSVLCCAFDKAGNSNCCNFTVTVRCPTNCIQAVCPSNIVVNCAGPNGAVVSFKPYATNVCTGAEVSMFCVPPSGSTFPLGITQVCCTNTTSGAAGPPVSCCFQVIVRGDTTPPTINCPSNVVAISQNCSPIDVFYPAPTASDDCQLDTVICKPPSGSVFPVGLTAVTCCATDKAGNSNCCTFTVTVRCPTNCVQVVCPSNIVVNCGGPNGAVVSFKAYGTNLCTGAELPVNCNPPSGSTFPLGVTQVCCTNTVVTPPAGTISFCCFTVTVRPDTTPPSILCPSNIVVTSPNCVPIDVIYPAPAASDNCQLDSVICKPPSGSPFPLGVTTVTCCAVDKAGNSNCCSFTLTVRCPTDCIRVVCPSNIVIDCAGPNGVVVTFNAYGTNFCTGAVLPVTCSRPSGSTFPPGVTTVCCTNSISGAAPLWCCFDVTVKRDTKPPVINCSSNIYIFCAKPNGAKVSYVVTAFDDCDFAPSLTCVPPSGSLFRAGCTNVTCTAVDRAGNVSSCSFKVCVLPQGCYLTNPSFELLGANLPPASACGDPIGFATGWSAFSGTPDLFRPPFASLAPGNCRGRENPCQGTNYAGLEGGYTASGGFVTEAMMGTLIAPLNNGAKFRLRACLSLSDTSAAPVMVEFVLANSANLAQQQVIHQVVVSQKNGWMQYLPPCFTVPQLGNWDRLIIRMAQVVPGTHTYPMGYVYVDNVNICCCTPVLHDVILNPTTVTVTWEGTGQLQGAGALSDTTDWRDITSPVETDPETGESKTTFPRPPGNLFFRIIGPDSSLDCAECGSGG